VAAYWTFLTLFSFLFRSSLAMNIPTAENTFVFRIDPSVKSAQLQVRYFLTGDFGGFGGYKVDQDGDNAILIHTEVDRKPAKGLKAVLYAPDCQIQTLSVADLSTSSREGEFHCVPVGETRLQGKFSRDPATLDREMEVQIRYLGVWAHGFFGIQDGFVLSLDIAKSSVEQDGSFEVYLPNLAGSGELPPKQQNADFQVLLIDANSGNILAQLKPLATLSSRGNLKILPSYPQTVEFSVDWLAASSAQ